MTLESTAGYPDEAEGLVRQYESVRFVDVHRPVLHLLPSAPGRVLDIGAGTGRDAGALAALGHHVVAVEPTAAMRQRAAVLHPGPGIEWVEDHLPDLARVARPGNGFDLILLTAVWMHLDTVQRHRAMPRVAGLLAPGGRLILSLRHGPVPPGRRMFAVSSQETIDLALAAGLHVVLRLDNEQDIFGRPEITWSRLGLSAPPWDAGAGPSLPSGPG